MALERDRDEVSDSTGRPIEGWPNGCTSIELPRDLRPAFGPECVVCGQNPPPDAPRAGRVPSWVWAPILLPSRFVSSPPACGRCALHCAALRVLGLIGVVGTMICASVLTKAWGWGWIAKATLSLGAPVLVGLLWSWAVPAWFDVRYGAAPHTLTYTFRRRDAAWDFAHRNAAPLPKEEPGEGAEPPDRDA